MLTKVITVHLNDNWVDYAPDKSTEVLTGGLPATYAIPVQTEGIPRCTIAMRSRQHHSHLR